ncbi:hypothetical protein C0995_010588 [Termitomyces sp. Mi166|nr:hypothetical protein C0995_010588 [Termitomyces sp. Mi166\
MVLKQPVIDAFRVIGVSPDTPEERTARVYKRLALEHHPDRNLDNVSAATTRFQEVLVFITLSLIYADPDHYQKIGAAWEICTRHYRNPQSSEVSATGYDEDDDLGEDDMFDYYEWMLYEMFMNVGFRFSRKGSFSYSGARSSNHEYLNEKSQRKEKEKYEQRIREFEAECAKQEREEAEAEREKMLNAQQRAVAQAEAFALARSGNSTGVRNIILRESINITAPEKVPKQQKKGPPTRYNTLLHIAASKCDVELVIFLLDQGADISALNKDNMTPFHSAILFGNTPVVQYFLSRRGKSSEGCHPSKAIPDGRTPLQMALASGSASTVKFLLKDATVHDVEHCWEQPLPVALRDILETKKGFVPPPLASNGAPLSRKAALKAEAARKQAAEKEEKARKIADERARAVENLRKKTERAAKRAEVERAKEVVRLQLEKEERQKTEEEAKLKADEEEHTVVEREAECRRVEEEARQRVQLKARQEEARRNATMEARQKMEAESESQREIEQEVERKRQAEAELQIRQREAELRRQEAEAHQREVDVRQREAEVRQREAEAIQNLSIARLEAKQPHAEANTQANHSKHQQTKSQPKKKATTIARRPMMDAEAKRAETLRRLQAQAEEHERLMEAITRKRAEQSARDKARHQRMKEEKVLRKNAKRAELGVDSSSPVQKERRENNQSDTTTRSHRYPLTPVSTSSSPVSWLTEPCYGGSGAVATPITPPMTPENLQTCAIPEDLFAYVPPKNTHLISSSSPSPSRGTRAPGNRGGHGHRGRGWRGRGRGRGGYVARHDSSTLGASYTRRDAEQELAEKNLGRW